MSPSRGNAGQAISLSLADGSSLCVVPADAGAAEVVARLQAAMQLDRPTTRTGPAVVVSSDLSPGYALADGATPLRAAQRISLQPHPLRNKYNAPTLQLIDISVAVCSWAQARGAVLVHGALAELNGRGVILAGRGGAGKTTASERLPPPWHALSDDATMVVQDSRGTYWLHPWPTWSRFILEERGGSWDVQEHVRLVGAFFLTQADEDQVVPIGAGHAAVRLVESSEQAWLGMSPLIPRDQLRARRLQRFDTICTLAKAIPCYELKLSLTGAFWEEIERVLEAQPAQ